MTIPKVTDVLKLPAPHGELHLLVLKGMRFLLLELLVHGALACREQQVLAGDFTIAANGGSARLPLTGALR